MRFTAILFILIIYTNVHGQLKKWELSLELSPTVSNITNKAWLNGMARFEPSYNAFIKAGYRINHRMLATFGFGYLVVKDYNRLPVGLTGAGDFTELLTNHHYYAATVGMKFNFGSFFINPELGIAFVKAHHGVADEYTFREDNIDVERTRFQTRTNSIYRSVIFPAMLSFGNEFDLGDIKLLLGIKTYYSLNRVQQTGHTNGKYYGLGVMTGVRF